MAEREKKTTKGITVVIGTLNRPAVVQRLLETLLEETKRFLLEVLVFDQSTEENYQRLKESFPQDKNFDLIRLEEPNTCKYLNLGWQKASHQLVLYLDDDVTITDKTIAAHLTAYDDKQVNGVAGRVINDNEETSMNPGVGKISQYGAVIEKNFSYEKDGNADFSYGCNMSFRRSVLEKLHGFDENLQPPVYAYNEVDVGYRMTNKWPLSMKFSADALVYHHRYPAGGTRNYSTKEIASSNNFNYGYFLGKNFSVVENVLCLVRRSLYQIMKEPQGLIPIIKGMFFAKQKNRTPKQIIGKLLILALFAVLLYLRLWKTPEFFSFNFDEEYQANLAWEQVKDFHPIWIGVSASNVNYYLGPGITYLNAALFWISDGDPAILGYFAFFFSVVTIMSLYFVSKELFSEKVAVFTTLFYAGSALINFYDRRFWNPMPVAFISIWLFYGLMKVNKKPALFILIAFLMGAALHVHLSLLIFTPLVFFFLLKHGKQLSWKVWTGMAAVYFLVTAPLIVYDLNHNFDNILFPIRFFQKTGDAERVTTFVDLKNHLFSLFNIFERIWFIGLNTNLQTEFGLGPHTPTINNFWGLTIVTIIVLTYLVRKSLSDKRYRLLAIIYALFFIAYIGYPGGTVEYFILGFIALFSIAAGIFFASLPKKIATVLIGIFLIANILAILTMTQERYGLLTRKRLIQKIMPQLENQTFYLETVGIDPRAYHPYGGWRHLFRVYGKTPTQSSADPIFGWIFPDELTTETPQLKVIIAEDISYSPKTKTLFTTKEGAFTVYITENK